MKKSPFYLNVQLNDKKLNDKIHFDTEYEAQDRLDTLFSLKRYKHFRLAEADNDDNVGSIQLVVVVDNNKIIRRELFLYQQTQ